MKTQNTIILANGVAIPRLGLGVWKMENGDETAHSVRAAIEEGYRLIDTATGYGNEAGVGQGIRDAGVEREQICITTKVWNDSQGYDKTLRSFEESRRKLGVEYIDLFLVHWPVAGRDGTWKSGETWRALEEIYKDGRVRAIGVSNFHPRHFDLLEKTATIKPMLNQIEIHPLRSQKPLREYCQSRGIAVEAYSPLARAGELFSLPQITGIAAKHGKTPAQVVLRWSIQRDVIVIPKSSNRQRLKENADIFSFALDESDMAAIDAIDRDETQSTAKFTFDGLHTVIV